MVQVQTDLETYERVVASAPIGARVPVEVTTTVDDPYAVYCDLRTTPGSFYLPTTGGQPGWGYAGLEPTAILSVDGGDEQNPLEALQAWIDAEELVRGPCSIPYPCGLFGWVSYDVARTLEALPDTTTDDRDLPLLEFSHFDTILSWKEPRNGPTTLHITVCPPTGDDPETTYREARIKATSIAKRATGVGPLSPWETSTPVEFTRETTTDAFKERVREAKGYIRSGESFQINLSQRLWAPRTVEPTAIFQRLRAINPAPYSAVLEFPSLDLVSASPELLVETDGKTVWTEPIAGTRPRGADQPADATLEEDLRSNDKERAEHAMLVDLARNDIGKIAKRGSVDLEEYRRVDRYSEVMHLVSSVRGQQRASVTQSDVLAAMFPGGTVTGAPKPRTMALIDRLESTRRGPYTGSVGCIGFDGRATFNIIIRTLVGTSDRYTLRVGAGIVADSNPDREDAETMDKARAIMRALQLEGQPA